MSEALRNRIQGVLSDLWDSSMASPASQASQSYQGDLKEAAAAFEKDMQPVCNALVEALQAGDLDALRGFRASLPHLLGEVTASPALADVLAHQLGKTLLDSYTQEAKAQGE